MLALGEHDGKVASDVEVGPSWSWWVADELQKGGIGGIVMPANLDIWQALFGLGKSPP